MKRQIITVFAFGLMLTALAAQQPTKDAPKIEVDVSFMNGSAVRLQVQSEKLEIATLYGKLSVPLKDVRFIEFGVHLPEGHAEKIDAAIKRLGHSDFREREKAVATLVDLGPYSYAAVLEATRAPEAEAANRAKTALQRLQAKIQKKDLKTSAEDKIVTPSFTIAGRIMTPTIKVKTEYFGEADLNLATMRTMRSLTPSGADTDVVIDAAKFAAAGQWLATSFQVDGRSTIVISARGQVDLLPEQPGEIVVGPDGLRKATPGGFVPAGGKKAKGINTAGVLVGKIGEDGDTFMIGSRFEGMPLQAGRLYLHINPSPYSAQPTGSYDVKAARKPD